MTRYRLPQAPKHQIPQCTTYELRDYRLDLERALTEVPAQSDDHKVLEQRLAEVTREQASRNRG